MSAVGFIRFLTVLAVSLTVSIGAHKAYAQGEPDDFMDDDEPFDEPIDNKAQQGQQGSRPRGPSVPAFNKNNIPGPNNNTNDIKNSPPPFSGNSGDISFRLVQPTKLWEPKKRRHRNRSDDKREAVKREAEIKEATKYEKDKNSSLAK